MAIIILNNNIGKFEYLDNEVAKQFTKAELLKQSNRIPAAIACIERVLKTCMEANHSSLTSTVCQKLAELHHLNGTINKVRECYIQAYDYSQGVVDPSALRLEQNECAISTSQALGTDSLGECMAVAIHHPETQTIGLAHVDIRTTMESISKFIGKMPQGEKNVTLIGGSDGDEELKNRSEENLKKIKTALSFHQDLNIQTLVTDQEHPTAFKFSVNGIIHPNVVPMGQGQNRFARNGLASFSDTPRDLRVAYQQKDQEMIEEAVILSEEVQKALQPYSPLTESEITELHIGKSLSPKIILAEEILALLKTLPTPNA